MQQAEPSPALLRTLDQRLLSQIRDASHQQQLSSLKPALLWLMGDNGRCSVSRSLADKVLRQIAAIPATELASSTTRQISFLLPSLRELEQSISSEAAGLLSRMPLSDELPSLVVSMAIMNNRSDLVTNIVDPESPLVRSALDIMLDDSHERVALLSVALDGSNASASSSSSLSLVSTAAPELVASAMSTIQSMYTRLSMPHMLPRVTPQLDQVAEKLFALLSASRNTAYLTGFSRAVVLFSNMRHVLNVFGGLRGLAGSLLKVSTAGLNLFAGVSGRLASRIEDWIRNASATPRGLGALRKLALSAGFSLRTLEVAARLLAAVSALASDAVFLRTALGSASSSIVAFFTVSAVVVLQTTKVLSSSASRQRNARSGGGSDQGASASVARLNELFGAVPSQL
jgi:hypothetical protein